MWRAFDICVMAIGSLAVLANDPIAMAQQPNSGDTFRDCDSCPEMVVIAAGEFSMGTPTTEPDHEGNESPQHLVKMRHAFAIGKFEVTFDEWDACVSAVGCSRKPKVWTWGRGSRPVINVSWHDAKEFSRWLTQKTGYRYRLPSEAEWEYAARADTMTARHWGNALGTGNLNCNGCGSQRDSRRTAPVGSFSPNRFGLHDTLGNTDFI